MAVDLPAIPQNAAIDSLMASLVDEAAHGLWALGRAGMTPPESETSWETVEQYAIQLIAAGEFITYGRNWETDSERVERMGWEVHSQDLADAGVMALDAAIRRDADGVMGAGDYLVTVCESCHQEYRLAPPMEGTLGPDR